MLYPNYAVLYPNYYIVGEVNYIFLIVDLGAFSTVIIIIVAPVMAAGSTARPKAAGDGLKLRPVEFRGLSTHYVEGQEIVVTFRYPVSSFRPHESDKVKLYAHRAPNDRSIASAFVGDTKKHRFCDGGLYKTGCVVIPTSTVRDLASRMKQYVLLYGSGKLRRVVGKSQPFIICPQSEYPSIQIRSLEDNILIDKLRDHSPMDEKQPLYPGDFGENVGGVEELSFVMVADSQGEGWESSEEEEEEENGEEEEEGEGIGSRREGWSGSWEVVEGRYSARRSSLSSSSHQSDTEDSEEESQISASEEDSEGETNMVATGSKELSTEANAAINGGGTSPLNKGRSSGCVVNGVTINTSPSPPQTQHVPTLASETEAGLRQHDKQTAQSVEEEREVSNGIPTSPTTAVPPVRPSKLAPFSENLLKDAYLLESIVLVEEEMSLEQTMMVKNANKDLHTKVRILHGKLEVVTRERDEAKACQRELERKVFVLEREKMELKSDNQKLSKDTTLLQNKVDELQNEVSNLSQHCMKQVKQIEHYETQLKIVSGEKEEFEKRVHYLEKKLKQYRASDHHYHRVQRQEEKTKPFQREGRGNKGNEEKQEKKRSSHAPDLTDSKQGTSAPQPYTGFTQRPVIKVFVSDPPEKRGGSRREKKRNPGATEREREEEEERRKGGRAVKMRKDRRVHQVKQCTDNDEMKVKDKSNSADKRSHQSPKNHLVHKQHQSSTTAEKKWHELKISGEKIQAQYLHCAGSCKQHMKNT